MTLATRRSELERRAFLQLQAGDTCDPPTDAEPEKPGKL